MVRKVTLIRTAGLAVWSAALALAVVVSAPAALADSGGAAGGLGYLNANQGVNGQIGDLGESQWAAIAFAANGIDVSSVSNGGASLRDYLLSEQPAADASAGEWEVRLLAIAAIGGDPQNFGGINYLQNLQALAVDHQMGFPETVDDDVFGLLALAAAGSSADTNIMRDSLNFVLTHQGTDGGFGWLVDTTCGEECGEDSFDTSAAIQALIASRRAGVDDPRIDDALARARQYLLSLRQDEGSFMLNPSIGVGDSISTSWAIMALYALGEGDSEMAVAAANWLLGNQNAVNGGFSIVSGIPADPMTTAHAALALVGKNFIMNDGSGSTPPTGGDTTPPSDGGSVTPDPGTGSSDTPTNDIEDVPAISDGQATQSGSAPTTVETAISQGNGIGVVLAVSTTTDSSPAQTPTPTPSATPVAASSAPSASPSSESGEDDSQNENNGDMTFAWILGMVAVAALGGFGWYKFSGKAAK